MMVEMTDDVATRVLVNNELQNACLGVATDMSAERTENFIHLIEDLEQISKLDRKREALPINNDLRQLGAAGKGLTRPEISVILSHTKLLLTDTLAEDSIVNDPLLLPLLYDYFPKIIVERYPNYIKNFPLRAQLVAMLLSNRMVHQASLYLPKWLKDRTGLGYQEIARAFCICSKLYDFSYAWQDAYDAKGLEAKVWEELLVELVQHIDRTLPWLLNQTELLKDMSGTIECYRPYFDILSKNLLHLLPPRRLYYRDEHERRLLASRVSPVIAARHANMRSMAAAPGIISLALNIRKDILDVARTYFMVGERFGFDSLREQARQSMTSVYWERQALSALIEDFSSHQLRMTELVLMTADGRLIQWEDQERQLVARLDTLMAELRQRQRANVTLLTVANRRLRGLIPDSKPALPPTSTEASAFHSVRRTR